MIAAVCQLCDAEFEIDSEIDSDDDDDDMLDVICDDCHTAAMESATSDWYSM